MKLEARPMAEISVKVKQKVPAKIETEQQLRDVFAGLVPAAIETAKRLMEDPLVTPNVKFHTVKYIIDKFLQEQPGGWNREDLTKLSFDKRKELARELFVSLAESMARRAGATRPQQAGGREAAERVVDALSGDAGLPGKPQDGNVPSLLETGAVPPQPEGHSGVQRGEPDRQDDGGRDGSLLAPDGDAPVP